MYPKTFVDKVECLESLVGIRSQCEVEDAFPFWVEDVEGLDVKKLAALARASSFSGKDQGQWLINSAAREMMGDIEMLLNDGYKMNNIIGDMCSTCNLIPSYTANSGIVVKAAVGTNFPILRITKLTILTNNTGTYTLVIDDGIDPQTFDVNLQAGVLMPIKLNYSSTQKMARVYFEDVAVQLGQVVCSTPSSCGCGGATTSNNPVHIAGILGGVEVNTQYGFLPCAAVDCSYDSLVCNLIQQVPNVFGQAMLYKIGEKYYANRGVSDRNNDAVSYGENQQEEDTPFKKYNILYWARLQGKVDRNSIKRLINDYLKKYRADKCVVCDSKLKTAYVTG
jgi:hypothetical protein